MDGDNRQQEQDERRQREEAWPHPEAIAKWYADFIGSVPHRPSAYQGSMDDHRADDSGWIFGVAERPSDLVNWKRIKEPK